MRPVSTSKKTNKRGSGSLKPLAFEINVFSSGHISDRCACLSGQAPPALGLWVLVVSAFVYGKPKALHVLSVRAEANRVVEAADLGWFRPHDRRCVPFPRDR